MPPLIREGGLASDGSAPVAPAPDAPSGGQDQLTSACRVAFDCVGAPGLSQKVSLRDGPVSALGTGAVMTVDRTRDTPPRERPLLPARTSNRNKPAAVRDLSVAMTMGCYVLSENVWLGGGWPQAASTAAQTCSTDAPLGNKGARPGLTEP